MCIRDRSVAGWSGPVRVGKDGVVEFRTTDQLQAGLAEVERSPSDHGTLEMIVRRPAGGEREILEEASLTVGEGLVGDNWNQKGSSLTEDGGPHPDMQLNVINSRFLNLIASPLGT